MLWLHIHLEYDQFGGHTTKMETEAVSTSQPTKRSTKVWVDRFVFFLHGYNLIPIVLGICYYV